MLSGERTDPDAIRAFLAQLDQNIRSLSATISLYHNPIAFENQAEIKNCDYAISGQVNLFDEIDSFLGFATDNLAFQHKEIVLGLFTPILATCYEAESPMNKYKERTTLEPHFDV